MPKLYIGDSNNNPIQLKKMYIGDSNNNPIKLKKIWVGDSNNNPVLIFSEGVPDGYMYDFDASFGQYNQSRVGYIINAVNGAPSKLQPWHLITDKTDTWGLSKWGGRPISFNNSNGLCGRGGTFRFPNPVDNATLVLVQRLSTSALGEEYFTNSCYFNTKGDYCYAPDYIYYTGDTIGSLNFRKVNGTFQAWDHANSYLTSFVDNQLCVVWLYTENGKLNWRIKAINGQEINISESLKTAKQIQDVRVCDWAGGGVYALTGDLYEFIIWPRSLTSQERADSEAFLLDKWSNM